MKFTLRNHLLQMTDRSNWPTFHTDDEAIGYEEAMAELHDVIMEYWDNPDMEKEA